METFFPALGMEGSPLSSNNHEVWRNEPGGAWAARPLELIREGGGTVLEGFAITDPYGREREVNTLLVAFSLAETQPKGAASADPVHAKGLPRPLASGRTSLSQTTAPQARQPPQSISPACKERSGAIQVTASSRSIANVWPPRLVQTLLRHQPVICVCASVARLLPAY